MPTPITSLTGVGDAHSKLSESLLCGGMVWQAYWLRRYRWSAVCSRPTWSFRDRAARWP